MYLKRLEIQGFKSFADKVELEFNPGITVVVGPNGSGKSNIVDSVRWVLGEQSAKTLRGMKMDDIIFSGSEGRRPLGMAQVSLTIDNSSGIFPLDYNEVTVTRKLYRSGESEYLINKVTCRMKDVHELFMDTGVGKEGFSVIGQGKIDEILSLKAEERRSLIEEAAGIVKYRYRKKEAQRKLDDTELNLLRVYDIIAELKGQLGPLEEQASKAKQYQGWKEEADQWEISLLLQIIEENKEKEEITTKAIQSLEDQLTETTTVSHGLKSKLENIKLEIQKLDQEISTLQQNYYNTTRDLEKNQHQIEMAKEKKSGLIAQLHKLKDSVTNLGDEEENLSLQLKKYKEEVLRIDGEYQGIVTLMEELTETLNHTKNTIHQSDLSVDDKKTALFDLLQEDAKINNEVLRLENEMNTFKNRSQQMDDKLKEINNQIKEEETNLLIRKKDIGEMLIKKSALDVDLIELNKSLEDNHNKQQILKIELQQKQENYQQTKSHLNILKGMEETGEGYQKGVKAIIEAQKANNTWSRGILGTVADIVKVPNHLETAIEIALGGSLQYIVAENDQVAQEAINFLKSGKRGRATFLPLNTINSKENHHNLQGDHVLGRASELVSYDPKYKKIIEFLLGRIWIVRDLAHAVELGKKAKFNVRLVTLDGEIINPGGALTGGSLSKNKTGLLTRKRLINEMTQKLQLFEKEVMEAKEKTEKNERYQEELLRNIAQIKEKTVQLTIEISQAESEKDQVQKEITRLATSIEVILFDQKQLQEQELTSKEEVSRLLGKSRELKGQHLDLENSIKEIEKSKKELAASQEEISEHLNREKVTIATLEQGKIMAQTRFLEIEERLRIVTRDQKKLLQEDQSLKDEIANLETLIIEGNEKTIEINLILNNQQQNLDKAKEVRSCNQGETLQIEQDIKVKGNHLEGMINEKHQKELNLAKLKSELENSTLKLEEQYKCTYEEAQIGKWEIINRRNTVKRINELRSFISELGLVNFAAINEFERVGQRLDFLEKQTTDLEEAKDTLAKVITEMDHIMAKKFKETFELVNASFTRVFAQLFDGGKASLELTDPTNVLQTGIEIIAQPPGKKTQSLYLLSGGERAMTAIALLLAILEVKPSPFCIFDEIEAALDESNVLKFAQYLKKFGGNSQFIIISHRKGTMEIGDFLYGITIEANGVSKLISVKLSEAM